MKKLPKSVKVPRSALNSAGNGLHTPPFYHNLVLVGNIAPDATTARSNPGFRVWGLRFRVQGFMVLRGFREALKELLPFFWGLLEIFFGSGCPYSQPDAVQVLGFRVHG